jgi:hypothetical protein
MWTAFSRLRIGANEPVVNAQVWLVVHCQTTEFGRI